MNNPIKDYDNFFLPVDDLDDAKKYYQETLGLGIKFDFAQMGMTALKVGDKEEAIILQDKKIHPQAKPAILFVVDDVRKTYEELKAKGVKFLSEPYEIHTGLGVKFEDPFGNMLGITDYSKMK